MSPSGTAPQTLLSQSPSSWCDAMLLARCCLPPQPLPSMQPIPKSTKTRPQLPSMQPLAPECTVLCPADRRQPLARCMHSPNTARRAARHTCLHLRALCTSTHPHAGHAYVWGTLPICSAQRWLLGAAQRWGEQSHVLQVIYGCAAPHHCAARQIILRLMPSQWQTCHGAASHPCLGSDSQLLQLQLVS